MKKALVVDLSYQVARNMSVPTLAALRTKDKVRTGGLFGTLKTIYTAAKAGHYDKIVCCMDSYPAFRKQLFPNYKHSRKSNPDSPEYQSYVAEDAWGWSEKKAKHFTFDELKDILPKLCVQVIIQENVEGDDLVYQTCKVLTDEGYECYAMSDDKDYLQLINLVPNLKVYRAMKGETITKENFLESCDVPYNWFIYYKAMCGDSSDEIPGIAKGLGEASIKEFIKYADSLGINPDNKEVVYGKLLNLVKIYDGKSAGRVKKIDESALEVLKKNIRLMDFRECPYGEGKKEELNKLLHEPLKLDLEYVMSKFKKYEFGSIASMLFDSTFKRLEKAK